MVFDQEVRVFESQDACVALALVEDERIVFRDQFGLKLRIIGVFLRHSVAS